MAKKKAGPRLPAFSRGASSANPDRVPGRKANRSGGSLRDKATIKRLKLYTGGRVKRDKQGVVVEGDLARRDRAGNAEITGATGRVALAQRARLAALLARSPRQPAAHDQLCCRGVELRGAAVVSYVFVLEVSSMIVIFGRGIPVNTTRAHQEPPSEKPKYISKPYALRSMSGN